MNAPAPAKPLALIENNPSDPANYVIATLQPDGSTTPLEALFWRDAYGKYDPILEIDDRYTIVGIRDTIDRTRLVLDGRKTFVLDQALPFMWRDPVYHIPVTGPGGGYEGDVLLDSKKEVLEDLRRQNCDPLCWETCWDDDLLRLRFQVDFRNLGDPRLARHRTTWNIFPRRPSLDGVNAELERLQGMLFERFPDHVHRRVAGANLLLTPRLSWYNDYPLDSMVRVDWHLGTDQMTSLLHFAAITTTPLNGLILGPVIESMKHRLRDNIAEIVANMPFQVAIGFDQYEPVFEAIMEEIRKVRGQMGLSN